MAKTKFIAVLDGNNRLVGRKEVSLDTPGVDPGDLLDNNAPGTYKYDEATEQFIPLGFGFGKVKRRQPYSTDFVVATLVEGLMRTNPDAVSSEAIAWLEWYNSELRIREEELAARKGQ